MQCMISRGVVMALLIGLIPLTASAQRVIYVDQQATGSNDGTSILNAYVALQDALTKAEQGDEIRVMAGVYTPDEGAGITKGDRDASFLLKNGVRLLGGFDRTNPTHSARDWEAHQTILSGDLQNDDSPNIALNEPTRSDNSQRVLMAAEGMDMTSEFSGFVIQGGHSTEGSGGGLYIPKDSQMQLSHLIFRENVAQRNGGALASFNSSLWLSDVSFISNTSDRNGGALYTQSESKHLYLHDTYFAGNRSVFGGALYIDGGNLVVTESTFISNRAGAGGAVMHRYLNPDFGSEGAIYVNVSFLGNVVEGNGGALCNEDGSVVTIYNGVFSGNRALSSSPSNRASLGGAIVNFESSKLTLIHNTMANNSGGVGGGIYSSSGDVAIYNSILQGNTSDTFATEHIEHRDAFGKIILDHNLFERAMPDSTLDMGGNLVGVSLFVDPLGPDGIAGTLDDDLRLTANSPAVDAGNNDILPPDVLDLDNDGDTEERLPLDMDRNQRIATGDRTSFVADLGAFEYEALSPISTDIEQNTPNPACAAGALAPAYPNPFTHQTRMNLCVASTGPAQVTLYDVLGREVERLFDGVIEANQASSIVIDRNDLASGVYFVRLDHKTNSVTRSIIVTE